MWVVVTINQYLSGVNDALLNHVDIFSKKSIITNLRWSLQDLLHNQRTLHTCILSDGHGRDAQRPFDNLNTYRGE